MKRFLILLFLLFFITSKVEARSGCCSHHSGVCGCGCCDGTSLSATCLPYYPQCMSGNTQNTVQEVQVYEPTAIPTLIKTPENNEKNTSDSSNIFVPALIGGVVGYYFGKRKKEEN